MSPPRGKTDERLTLETHPRPTASRPHTHTYSSMVRCSCRRAAHGNTPCGRVCKTVSPKGDHLVNEKKTPANHPPSPTTTTHPPTTSGPAQVRSRSAKDAEHKGRLSETEGNAGRQLENVQQERGFQVPAVLCLRVQRLLSRRVEGGPGGSIFWSCCREATATVSRANRSRSMEV
jgi:hypothetical protein